MKKIYFLTLGLLLGAGTMAQNDISVALNNYTSMEGTSDDPLDLVFTITNEGATIPSGDTVFLAFLLGTSNYSMDLTSGSVTYFVLDADFDAATSIDMATLSPPVSTMDMDWIYGEIGLNGNICAFAGIGQGSLAAKPAYDADYTDNQMCVFYTVTEVAGIEEDLATISVYPNPAANVLNFNLGNNQIEVINVMDISGRIVDVINVNGSIETLNTEAYDNGVYFYQMVKGGEVLKTDKFVVSK